MCEYCGCQQLRVVDELTREHDEVVALVARVRDLVEEGRLDDVAATCRRMSAVLAPHTTVEADGLFPELSAEFPEHVAILRGEHREVESVLAEATERTPDDPAWPGRLVRALHLLREHILKQQDGVFPTALATLDGAQWDRVEAVRAHAGSAMAPATPCS